MAKLLSLKGLKLYPKLLYFIVISMVFLFLIYFFKVLFYTFPAIRRECNNKEPIDVVYTWVNGSDPSFIRELNDFLKFSNIPIDKMDLYQRFNESDELKFSLRSLEQYAPWINHVYIVTNGQIPYWLNLDYERVTIVTHKQIFLDQNHLPTFSSPAIESHIHRIPGLSKKFLYFNDDLFLGQPIYLDDFISPNKGYSLYLSYPLPRCAPLCFWAYVADNQCDEACNNFYCQYDGGDCERSPVSDKVSYEMDSDSIFLMKNNRKILFNENKTKNSVSKSRQFKIPRGLEESKNYSIMVEEYNNKMIKKEKLKRIRLKRQQRHLRVMKMLTNNNTDVNSFNRTQTAYIGSIQYSNRLFNLKYGFMPRAVQSHTPVLIDRDIMNSLQKKFFKEVWVTSSNKFRSHNDLQYSFTYYYFILHERIDFNIDEIFKKFDTDISGTWSDRELRVLLTRLYQLPLSYSIVEHFESILLNCSKRKKYETEFERYLDSRLPTISKELVFDCSELVEMLEAHFGKSKKYKYQVERYSPNHYLHMVTSNVTQVVEGLDEIRSEPRKFICLNNNFDHTKEIENELVKSILYDFYLSLFPFPSKFELPEEYRNRFLHIDELNEWKNRHFKIKLFIYAIVLFIFYLVGFNVCIKKICVVINRLFY